MKTLPLTLLALLLLCSAAALPLHGAASTATNRIRGSELSTTNRIYSSNTLFAVVFPYPHPYYTNGTMQITAEDLLASLQLLPGWAGGGSGNGLTNNETRAIELLSSLRVTGRVTNDNVVQFNENISQATGYNADLWFLSARTLDLNGTNIATALHIIQTNVVWTSNELYSAIIAAGISANTATNISRYWATNAALTTSNQLMNLLASRTNPTLYGTVTVPGVTASEVAAFDSSKGLTTVPGISPTELGFIDGLEENVQDAITSLSSRAGLLESQTITNELSAALQIVNRVLSLSPGILSNLVASGHGTPYIAVGTNGGTLSFATNLLWRGLVISNDAAGIYSIHAPASSAGSGTNNPVLTAGPTIAIIANQTARGQFTTNASYTWTHTGASNQSSMLEFEFGSTATNLIYNTNLVGYYDVDLGSNVTVTPLPPLSKTILRMWLNRSNEWIGDVKYAAYALEFANGTTDTNHTLKKVTYTAPSGSGGGGTLGTTNITLLMGSATNQNLDLAYGATNLASFDLRLQTNGHVTISNIASLPISVPVPLWVRQDTNGNRNVISVANVSGRVITNGVLSVDTNANAGTLWILRRYPDDGGTNVVIETGAPDYVEGTMFFHNGGQKHKAELIAGNLFVGAMTNNFVAIDTSGASRTVTLTNTAAIQDGFRLRIKNLGTNGNTVTVNRTGTDLIDFQTSNTLTNLITRSFVKLGTNWMIE